MFFMHIYFLRNVEYQELGIQFNTHIIYIFKYKAVKKQLVSDLISTGKYISLFFYYLKTSVTINLGA